MMQQADVCAVVENAFHDEAVAAASAAATVARRKKGSSSSKGSSTQGGLRRLESFENIPAYLQDNEYIVGFYRAEQKTVWGSVKTLFTLHNETGNVWSHLLGFLLFVGLALYFTTHPPTPLAVTAEHLDGLWHELAAEVHGLHLGDRASALSHTLQDGVAAIEGRLSHALTDNLHSLQDSICSNSLLHRVQSVGHSLTDNLHSLQESVAHGLHAVESSLAERAGALQGVLRQQLRPIVQWPAPRWPVYVYFAGACVCMLTSGVCHLLGCCSQHIAELVWRFDYAGIATLIVASFVPAMYYAFLCQPFWRNFYLISTISMGCAVVGVSLPTVFQARQYRALRAAVFMMLGAWGVVPVSHLLLHHSDVWAIRTAFRLDLLMGAIYVAGAAIYAWRVPERWFPGRFDILGHSHQLWHGAVVLAAWVHYCAIMLLLQWRDAAGGCAVPASVNGPVHEVLTQLQAQGKAPLGIEQVHATIAQQLARVAAAAAASGSGGGAAAPPVHMDL